MNRQNTVRDALLFLICLGGAFFAGNHLHRAPPEPVYFDVSRIIADSSLGRDGIAQLQRDIDARNAHVAALADSANRLPDGQEKNARAQDVRNESQRAQQANARQGDDVGKLIRERASAILGRTYPGRPQVAVACWGNCQDVTSEVVAALDAANEDQARRAQSLQAEIERLRRQLADRAPAPPAKK